MSKILAIIPARGGSKRIPGKNLKRIENKTLVEYAIEAARACSLIERVIVSTNDEQIAEIAVKAGAEVPFIRPAELAQDHTTDLPVFVHALEWLQEQEGYSPDVIVHLRPTAPLRTAKEITKALLLFLKSDTDSLRSVTPVREHPAKMWREQDGRLISFYAGVEKESYNIPKQKLERVYVQNGAIDIVRRDVLLKKHSMSGDRILGFIMENEKSVNIDIEIDLLLAELLMKRSKQEHGVKL